MTPKPECYTLSNIIGTRRALAQRYCCVIDYFKMRPL